MDGPFAHHTRRWLSPTVCERKLSQTRTKTLHTRFRLHFLSPLLPSFYRPCVRGYAAFAYFCHAGSRACWQRSFFDAKARNSGSHAHSWNVEEENEGRLHGGFGHG